MSLPDTMKAVVVHGKGGTCDQNGFHLSSAAVESDDVVRFADSLESQIK